VPVARVNILTAPTKGSGAQIIFPAGDVDTAEKQAAINDTFVRVTRATYARSNPRYTVVCRPDDTLSVIQITEILQAGMERLGYSFDVVHEQITDDKFTTLF
jgi:hypothetical protein